MATGYFVSLGIEPAQQPSRERPATLQLPVPGGGWLQRSPRQLALERCPARVIASCARRHSNAAA